MEQQRPFLYLSVFFLCFLIWTTWQQKHAPIPAVVPTTATESDTLSIPSSVPSAIPTSSATAAVSQAETVNAEEKLISIKTDVLDISINTVGGTIVQADLPAYPISLEETDTAVRIVNKEKDYAAQSGLVHSEIVGKNSSDFAPNHYAIFASDKQEYVLADGQNTVEVPLTWSKNGVTVTKTFGFKDQQL